MSLRQFNLTALTELDGGKAAEAFARHVRRAAEDCADRPGDRRARKVVLEVSLTPELEPDGDCSEAKAQFRVSSTVPKHQTKVYSLGLRANGVLVYNPDSPDAVNQGTMFDPNEEA